MHVLYCGRRKKKYFKIAQTGTLDKKRFFHAKAARKLLLKAANVNGMLLLSTNLKLNYPKNKLIL